MSKLNLAFTGIGLCYFDEEITNWRVLIPKIENNHDFEVKVEKSKRDEGIKIIEEIQYIKIPVGGKIKVLNNKMNQQGINNTVAMNQTLDMNSLHNESKGILLHKDKNRYAAFVTLLGFSLESDKSPKTERFYNVWKATSDIKTRLNGELSGRKNVVSHQVSAKTGSITSITVNGEEVYQIIHDNFDYDVIFDNDCHEIHSDPNTLSDFKYYYNIIDWENLDEPCRFELSPIPAKCDYVGCDLVKTGKSKPRFPEELIQYLNA